jgi:excinuclease ABC subunit C
LQELEEKMKTAASFMEYEDAIEYRDLLGSVRKVAQQQKITSSDMEDRDIIAFAQDGSDAVVQVFFVRDGKLVGREHFHVSVALEENRSQIMGSFIKQYYAGTPLIPRELILQDEVEEEEVLIQWLTSKRGQKVYLRVPKKGQKEQLVDLAARNARMILDQDKEKIKREEERTLGAMQQVADWLKLTNIHRVEAFDISNTSGYEPVGSMVVFEDGKPKRSDYRKFRIRTVAGPDDYASMAEVLTRRFEHGMEEKKELLENAGSFTRFPDLIMMDGGRGQVNIALAVLKKLGLVIPVCGMVKDDNHRTRGVYFQNLEIPIDRSSEGFKLVTRIQDEAHRFAIEYHRSLRSKGQVHSVLDDIATIGPTRRRALMRYFKGIEELRAADIDTLKAVPSMNESAARKVWEFFHPANPQETVRAGEKNQEQSKAGSI